MNSQPLVCICIPHYNNESTIAETLDSLVNQTYKNIIIKIFDNVSTDSSITILKKYEAQHHNIHVFQNKINIGGEANFTQCIQSGEGAYTAVFHADDVYLPTMIEEQVKFLEEHLSCSAVAAHAYTIDENTRILGERFLPKLMQQKDHYIFENEIELLKETLKYGNIITCPSVMVRTEIFKSKIQKWNGLDFKTSADLDVWLRLARFGAFGFLTKPLMQYRLSTKSYSYNMMRIRTEENDMFLVLNSYMTNDRYQRSLSNTDRDNYAFLLFKDNVNRTINQIISKRIINLPLSIFDWNIMQTAFISKENIKIYIAGVIVKLLRNISLPGWVLEKLYFFRFGDKKSHNGA
ncbi:MAG: glycosyltransferase [Sulfurospirillaceae bacterium]|nr:glycosyltransferase [Sulfurospirillaceae bacterium]